MDAEKLRDLSQPMDVALLDATVAAFYGTGSKEQVWTIPPFAASLCSWLFVRIGIQQPLNWADFVWLGDFMEF